MSISYLPLPPLVGMDERGRVEMTCSCHDCDSVPKVPGAGQIVTEDGRRVQVMHNGLRVVAGGYHGDWMAEIITRLRGHHEPQEEAVFNAIMERIPARATMVELGGFWSYYSLWFLQGDGRRRAIVVEPDPNNIEIGRANAALNGASPEFIQACVGAEPAASIEFHTETAGAVRIPRVSVPELMRARGIDHLDVLHCDTQGAETAVIASCFELFRERRVSFALFSTHAAQISGDPLTHQRALFAIQQAGGQVLVEHDVHESFSGDGLIAAYFGSGDINWPKLNISYNRYSTSLFRNPLYDLAERAG